MVQKRGEAHETAGGALRVHRAAVMLAGCAHTTLRTEQASASPVAHARRPPVFRSIDVYGTDRFTGDEVAAEFKTDIDTIVKAFAVWPPNADIAGPASRDIKLQLKSRAPFAYFDLGVTFAPAPDNGLYMMIDAVEEKDAARRMPFYKAPAETLPDPGGLIAKWSEYQDKVFKLMYAGTPLKVTDCPVLHCLAPFNIPELAPYLPIFTAGAKAHEKELYAIAAHDKNPEHRAIALFVLAHTDNAAKLLPVLGHAIHDPSDIVRNNAMRIMIFMAQSDPNRDYPIVDLIAALDFPSADDRNKSGYVLVALVESPRYRSAIKAKAVPTLLKLLRLKQANNHDPAYEILKALSGESFGERDYTAWEDWAATIAQR